MGYVVATQFFSGVHGLRALAAVLVLFSHAIYFGNGHVATPGQVWLGRAGVMLFFAISGFVIALQRRKPVASFIKHRALRIYPSYWIALAVETVLFTAIGLPTGVTPDVVLLYPTVPQRLATSIPYWTLAFEVTFYFITALLFSMRLSDRQITGIAVLWIMAVNLLGSKPLTEAGFGFPGLAILLSPAMQVLPIGLICGIHFAKLRQMPRAVWITTALGALVASFTLPDLSNARMLALGIGSASLLVVVAERSIPAFLRRLGDASYGIYLVHVPVMVAISPSAGIARLTMISLILGTLYGLFDVWLYSLLVNKRAMAPAARAVPEPTLP
ncbi:acyltransferase family protein [Bradyrhizobium yuanmingense]|uniref:acyltransferase family protein n=1 Tax=Bradyrhizobium yuanmingense TaxID=108015 RepID=UPI0023B9CA4D|nr:acyltransferase [Bradyrhizobium yuanmingense]MDF0583777.1 acyltransferase [Bradyrhizobium yuanmingense]